MRNLKNQKKKSGKSPNERFKEMYPTDEWQSRFYQAVYGGK